MRPAAAIFHVSGVFVDMPKTHYFALRRIAEELAVPFTEEDEVRTRGAGSLGSIEIILEMGGLSLSQRDKQELMTRMVAYQEEYVRRIGPADLMTGSVEILQRLKSLGASTAVIVGRESSAYAIDRAGIGDAFDCRLSADDGIQYHTHVEDFRIAASRLGTRPDRCVAFLNNPRSIGVASEAGCAVAGIGEARLVGGADLVLPGLWAFRTSHWDLLGDLLSERTADVASMRAPALEGALT
jgi:beta-phosphoglucomutase-like phosphatase (HAD superfamily)